MKDINSSGLVTLISKLHRLAVLLHNSSCNEIGLTLQTCRLSRQQLDMYL